MINYFSHQQLSAAAVRKHLVEAVIDSDNGESGGSDMAVKHTCNKCLLTGPRINEFLSISTPLMKTVVSWTKKQQTLDLAQHYVW